MDNVKLYNSYSISCEKSFIGIRQEKMVYIIMDNKRIEKYL